MNNNGTTIADLYIEQGFVNNTVGLDANTMLGIMEEQFIENQDKTDYIDLFVTQIMRVPDEIMPSEYENFMDTTDKWDFYLNFRWQLLDYFYTYYGIHFDEENPKLETIYTLYNVLVLNPIKTIAEFMKSMGSPNNTTFPNYKKFTLSNSLVEVQSIENAKNTASFENFNKATEDIKQIANIDNKRTYELDSYELGFATLFKSIILDDMYFNIDSMFDVLADVTENYDYRYVADLVNAFDIEINAGIFIPKLRKLLSTIENYDELVSVYSIL